MEETNNLNGEGANATQSFKRKRRVKSRTPSKRVVAVREKVNKNQVYSLSEAINLVKNCATAKFDETIETHIRLNIDTKQSDQNVRGLVGLPHGTGVSVRVAVFAKGAKLEEAKAAGADIYGEEDLVEQIKAGQINFDRCIATPDMMLLVGKVAKILGPKGLMPNPKLGTVTNNIGEAVKNAKAGQVEFRADKGGVIHVRIGKASFSDEALKGNFATILDAITKAKPNGVKGTYVLGIHLNSTMGPSVIINLSEVMGGGNG